MVLPALIASRTSIQVISSSHTVFGAGSGLADVVAVVRILAAITTADRSRIRSTALPLLARRAGGARLLRGGIGAANNDDAQYDQNCFLHRALLTENCRL